MLLNIVKLFLGILSSSKHENMHCLPEQWETVRSPVLILPHDSCTKPVVVVVTVVAVVVLEVAVELIVVVLTNFLWFFCNFIWRNIFRPIFGRLPEHLILIEPFGGIKTPVSVQTIVLKNVPESSRVWTFWPLGPRQYVWQTKKGWKYKIERHESHDLIVLSKPKKNQEFESWLSKLFGSTPTLKAHPAEDRIWPLLVPKMGRISNHSGCRNSYLVRTQRNSQKLLILRLKKASSPAFCFNFIYQKWRFSNFHHSSCSCTGSFHGFYFIFNIL